MNTFKKLNELKAIHQSSGEDKKHTNVVKPTTPSLTNEFFDSFYNYVDQLIEDLLEFSKNYENEEENKHEEVGKSITPSLTKKSFDPCQYLDQVCESLSLLAASTSNENKEMAMKIKDTAIGIKADKENYIKNQTSGDTYIEGLNKLQNKVTHRLNNIITSGKYHVVGHYLHKVYTAIYELYQHTIAFFSEAKKQAKTKKILSVKERYETSCGLFAIKNAMKKEFKTGVKASEADARLRVQSYF